jgi:hypothetical protein
LGPTPFAESMHSGLKIVLVAPPRCSSIFFALEREE